MNEQLKPCPKCYSKVELIEIGNDYTKIRKITIKCKSCFIQRTWKARVYDMNWLRNVAIQDWNTRPESVYQKTWDKIKHYVMSYDIIEKETDPVFAGYDAAFKAIKLELERIEKELNE